MPLRFACFRHDFDIAFFFPRLHFATPSPLRRHARCHARCRFDAAERFLFAARRFDADIRCRFFLPDGTMLAAIAFDMLRRCY